MLSFSGVLYGSQIDRFFNTISNFIRSMNSYLYKKISIIISILHCREFQCFIIPKITAIWNLTTATTFYTEMVVAFTNYNSYLWAIVNIYNNKFINRFVKITKIYFRLYCFRIFAYVCHITNWNAINNFLHMFEYCDYFKFTENMYIIDPFTGSSYKKHSLKYGAVIFRRFRTNE